MTSEQQTPPDNTNSTLVDTVVDKVQTTITQTTQTVKDQAEQRIRRVADDVRVEAQEQGRTSLQKARSWFAASNRRTLVIGRKGRPIVRLPLTVALFIVAAAVIASFPAALIAFGIGVILRLSLNVEIDPAKRK